MSCADASVVSNTECGTNVTDADICASLNCCMHNGTCIENQLSLSSKCIVGNNDYLSDLYTNNYYNKDLLFWTTFDATVSIKTQTDLVINNIKNDI